MTKKWILAGILTIAVLVRFINFEKSIYFGFDEARDAFVSQAIYQMGDYKLMGPPATGDMGLYHGPLYWYLLGPLYLMAQGDPMTISVIFRLINALGVFVVFYLGRSFFGMGVATLAAWLYAVSFEQSQYAMYVGNPSWGVWAFLLILIGIKLLMEKNQKSKYGLYLMVIGASLATQFNLMYAYLFLCIGVVILWQWKILSRIQIRHWLGAGLTTLAILSSYIATEVRYNFRTVKKALELVSGGFGVMAPGESKYLLYWNKYIGLFRDNIFDGGVVVISILAIGVSGWILYKALRDDKYKLLSGWLFAWVGLMMLGGHSAYYTNIGIGIGVIMSVAVILEKIWSKNIVLGVILLLVVTVSNVNKVFVQSSRGLIDDIKPQPGMLLTNQYKIIDTMYEKSRGSGFTVRVTGIPYGIQTVWAYLFQNYGQNKYGYLPYYETGNVLGYPGKLPTPINGSTCMRFLVREPMRGLPVSLVEGDVVTEDIFSEVITREEIGLFVFETRRSRDINCHSTPAI